MLQRYGLLTLRACYLLIAASVIAGCNLDGTPTSPTDTFGLPGLEGHVIDAETRKGLPDALVSTQGSAARTSISGQYRIEGLPKGASLVIVTHPGYAEVRQTVTITGNWSATSGTWLDPADFEMQPQK